MLNNIIIRIATEQDLDSIYDLALRLASIPDGIARTIEEIKKEDIAKIIENSLRNGKIFVAELVNNENSTIKLIGNIYAYKYEPLSLRHCLGNLTIGVDKEFSGKGIGKALFKAFLDDIIENNPEIARVQLETRESNIIAISLYKSLGFQIEGIMKNRILDSKGNLTSDIMMSWFNPRFKK